MMPVLPRTLPVVSPETKAFWTGGRNNQLLIQRCTDCGRYQHPPQPLCPTCLNRATEMSPVSGTGRIRTYTINYQQWLGEFDSCFVFGAIELSEQVGLYVFSNVLAAPTAVHIGMPVKVTFERHQDVWLPLFKPDGTQECADAA